MVGQQISYQNLLIIFFSHYGRILCFKKEKKTPHFKNHSDFNIFSIQRNDQDFIRKLLRSVPKKKKNKFVDNKM